MYKYLSEYKLGANSKKLKISTNLYSPFYLGANSIKLKFSTKHFWFIF